MHRPLRLELNNSGAWKLLGRFDGDQLGAAQAIVDAADALARALNDPACGRPGICSMRIATDEAVPRVQMEWSHPGPWRLKP